MAITEVYMAYADVRFNKVRVIQCEFNDMTGNGPAGLERVTLKATEFLADKNVHINRYYYVPSGALNNVEVVSIVRLLDERMLMEPALIHSPVLVTMVLGDDKGKAFAERIKAMKQALKKQTGVAPSVSYEMIPDEFTPAHWLA